MASSELNYYRRRERQEREIAERSPDPQIAAIHAAMADRYASLLNGPPMLPDQPELSGQTDRAPTTQQTSRPSICGDAL